MNATSFLAAPSSSLDSVSYRQQHLSQTYAAFGATIIQLYDHALTFDDEVQHIWNSQQNALTIVWFILRYYSSTALFLKFTPRGLWRCVMIQKINLPPMSLLITTLLANIIMIIRTYALYQRNTNVLVCLVFLLVVEMLLLGFNVYLRHEQPSLDKKTDCVDAPVNSKKLQISSVYWAGVLLEDLAVFVFTVCKSRKHILRTAGARSISPFTVIMRDGTLYFAVVCVLNAMNLFLFLLAPVPLKPLGGSISRALTTLLVCRIVLNLRKHNHQPDVETRPMSSCLPNLTTIAPAVGTEIIDY
ncbi:hypothetical protein K439DRAFT_116198 [Ramaria rubella]|nr:hypothetical protein K439DRAFT_116198 [Ramaria rubella]